MSTVSSEQLQDFVAALSPRLEGEVRTDAISRGIYATDASMYQIQPLGVLIPRHVDDVQAALEEAARFDVPVLPRGGGSSLAGQTVGAALVIDFTKHLDAVLEVNPEERWVRVQPGLVLDHLNSALAQHDLKVGPDPASSSRATLGGMVGNNATGTHSILYGNIVNHILASRTLLVDGSQADFGPLTPDAWSERLNRSGLEGDIYRNLDALLREKAEVIERDTPRHWRRNSGYRLEYLLEDAALRGALTGPGAAMQSNAAGRNIAQLLCGSEGTLAVTTELTLSLVQRPRRSILGVVHYETREEALRSVTTILETEPSAVELFDGVAIEQARRAPGFAHRLTFIEGAPGAVLITEYYGEEEAELKDRVAKLQEKLTRVGFGYAVILAVTPGEIQNVWTVRNEGLGLIMGVKGDHKPHAFIEDASVPAEHLADYIDELQRVLEGTRTVYYAHASAGCLHIRPFINTKDVRDVEKMREIALGSTELVRRFGGAVSSEHGDGIARSWLLEPLVGKELYEVYRRVKQIFDPHGRLNPGNVVDARPMTSHLRMGPSYATIPIVEEFDFSKDGGFAKAVELCNGNGACRKMQSGTMCPSFMVTREEEHSTRGRANALRAAMSGLAPVEDFTSRRLYDVLDLCVECKGCKTECPSNVDMSKIKSEWLSKYWEANGLPLRTRLFANLPVITRRITGTFARSANWVNRRKTVRKMLERTIGISPKRRLPEFAPEPFTDWFSRQKWAKEGQSVVLFADTFNNYNHPETSRAAAEFLRRVGFNVIVPDAKACCGRPYISKGLISEAQIQALRTVEMLHKHAAEGIPIVGLEPSCILTFRDEFLSLLPGDIRAQQLAELTLTFEEFVARLGRTGALDEVRWSDETREVLLHGHCHQKALVGTGPAEFCLSLPPNYSVRTVDSGCCGMAGAFGYEKEHYEISIAMAERRLAPAVRAEPAETIIAAAGISCREQIKDTTGRKALHPAEILLAALA